MPIYYPQINANLILTQLPYRWNYAWGTTYQDVESGMRWAYPLRGAGLSGYPTGPLAKFGINYSQISDAEVNTLDAFFNQQQGSYAAFRFLDPGGNLLQYSETFSNAYWSKSASVSPGQTDPFGGTRAFSSSAGVLEAVVGPSDGGMSGFVMCASVYLKGAGTSATLGFVDASTSTQYTTTVALGSGWTRAHFTLVLPTNNQFLFYLFLNNSATIFGAQVAPTKGEGAYIETPGESYGYHQNVRFDVDSFAIKNMGPNQNQVSLPCVEFFA